MARGIPISRFVDIQTRVAAGGVLRTEFGTGLAITTDDALPAGGPNKAQAFTSLDAVNAVLDVGPALDAASVWFARAGVRALYVGRWATTDVSTTLRGSTPAAISSIAAANAGFTIGGTQVTVSLSAATTYAAIATSIQAAIATQRVASVTVTSAGTGYSQATTSVTFSGGGGVRQATGTVTVSAGAVTAVAVTDPGQGYTSIPTVTIADTGSGTGATATAVLEAVDTRLRGATFTYDVNAFVLSLAGTADIGSTFGSPATGTDISTFLGFARGTTYLPGHDAETVVDAVGEMIDVSQGGAPVGILLAADAPLTHTLGAVTRDTRDDLAAFAETGDYVFGLLDTAEQALVSNDDLSHAARVFANQQRHTEVVYSKPGELPEIGLMALLSSQNLNQPNSIITPHLKSIGNVEPTNVTENQLRELTRKRTNVYTTVGGLPSLVGGYTGKAGSWLDAEWWLLWVKNEHELAIFNAMRAAPRFDTAILTNILSQVNTLAARSGGIRPGGRVNASTQQDIIRTTGNVDFNGILTAGFLSWIEQPTVRSDLDRENRIGRFKTWYSPADAIHQVFGDLILSG